MKATIYHNPKCGTSRKALEILRDSGCDVWIHEYLKNPPTRDELIDIMLAQPILINRPIVETSKGVRLCRPQELVREIL